jgi:hypothetical protein
MKKNINSSLITKIVLILVLIVFLAAVYSRANAKNVPMSTIESDLRSKTDMGSMEKLQQPPADAVHRPGLF